MDQQQDWYDQYMTTTPVDGNYRYSRKKQKKTVGLPALIACVLAAALIAGGLGGYCSKLYFDSQLNSTVASLKADLSASVDGAVSSAVSSLPAGTGSSVTSMGVSGSSGAYSKSQIIELVASSVVGIDVVYPTQNYSYWGYSTQQSTGSGSGIIITNDGYIVTCNHVVENASEIKVVLNDDTEYSATLVGTDTRNDLAVIKVEATGLSACTLGDSDTLTVGEEVVAIGNPLGELRGTATSGIVSALNRSVTVESVEMSLLQTDAAISPGNSGGGLFNASGSLVGIVNAKASSDNAEGLGFAIPVSSVKQIISDLVQHGYVRGRAYLGVYTQNVTLSYGDNGGWGGNSYFGSFFGNGTSCVQVAQVVAGSAAAQAGILEGDLILAVNDTKITSGETLSTAISAYNAGDTATLTIQRDGEQSTVTVTFGEYTPTK